MTGAAERRVRLAAFTSRKDVVPVTAKLSRRFYEQFGDELTSEFLELINTVDAAYKSELREINELSFARFDAKQEQRLAELRLEFRTEIANLRADLIKWMFLFFTGSALTNILLR